MVRRVILTHFENEAHPSPDDRTGASAMKQFTIATAIAVLATLFLSGCIVLDQVTTISVHPDGSAKLVLFHSNIRSTEDGPKADQELRQYVQDFDAKKSEDFVRITAAGGEVLDARWLQRELPFSTSIVARLPTARALERFWSIEEKDDELRLTTRFSAEGTHRKLTMVVLPPPDLKITDNSTKPQDEIQQDKANSFSETRIVVIGGRIVACQGLTVADDKRSALLSVDEVARLLRKNPDRLELFIEWEVANP
jgi:hypothetical protein